MLPGQVAFPAVASVRRGRVPLAESGFVPGDPNDREKPVGNELRSSTLPHRPMLDNRGEFPIPVIERGSPAAQAVDPITEKLPLGALTSLGCSDTLFLSCVMCEDR